VSEAKIPERDKPFYLCLLSVAGFAGCLIIGLASVFKGSPDGIELAKWGATGFLGLMNMSYAWYFRGKVEAQAQFR